MAKEVLEIARHVVDARTSQAKGDVGKAIERLIHSEELRDRLGLQAIEYVRREWVWARTLDCYLREVGSVISNPLQAVSR